MYTNLSMAMAQEHQRDLRRQAEAANLARSGDPSRTEAASPRFARISFSWSVRRPARAFALPAAKPRSLA
jgi:hypothetical protein